MFAEPVGVFYGKEDNKINIVYKQKTQIEIEARRTHIIEADSSRVV